MTGRPVGLWPEAFLGMSAALGEPLEESLEALDPQERRKAAVLETSLRSPSQEVRARSIARAVAEVVIGLDEMLFR